MDFHSRLVGALDALIFGLAGFVTLALLFALIDPSPAGGHIRAQADPSSLAAVEHAPQAVRL